MTILIKNIDQIYQLLENFNLEQILMATPEDFFKININIISEESNPETYEIQTQFNFKSIMNMFIQFDTSLFEENGEFMTVFGVETDENMVMGVTVYGQAFLTIDWMQMVGEVQGLVDMAMTEQFMMGKKVEFLVDRLHNIYWDTGLLGLLEILCQKFFLTDESKTDTTG